MTLFLLSSLLTVLPIFSGLVQTNNSEYSILVSPSSPAPAPSSNEIDVISVYSDSFSDIPNTNFYADWNQNTSVSEVDIDGNKTLKYSNFNYQGIELGSSVNASQMEYVHIDIWALHDFVQQCYFRKSRVIVIWRHA